jgi:hypothetical protein
MAKKKQESPGANKEENQPVNPAKQQAIEAHDEAEKDIEKDPELNSRPDKGDDLDEGELARLEGED